MICFEWNIIQHSKFYIQHSIFLPYPFSGITSRTKPYDPQLSYHFFTYVFFDEAYSQLYRSELVMGQLTNYFAFLAIVISCLGLFGLASFTVEQRTKEIGIRKVMGASVINLMMLLSKSYIKLILIAFAIAIPVANYFLTEWLRNFAYKTEVAWWLYSIPGLLILLIALLTISQQTLKAAIANPVESLRYE